MTWESIENIFEIWEYFVKFLPEDEYIQLRIFVHGKSFVNKTVFC